MVDAPVLLVPFRRSPETDHRRQRQRRETEVPSSSV